MRHKISGAVVQILSSFVRQKTVGKGDVKSFNGPILSTTAECSKAINLNLFPEHFFHTTVSFSESHKSLFMYTRLNNLGTARKGGDFHGDRLSQNSDFALRYFQYVRYFFFFFAQVRKMALVSLLPNYPSMPQFYSIILFIYLIYYYYSGENRPLFQHVISIHIRLDSFCQSNHKERRRKKKWGTLKLLQLLSRAWAWTKRTRLMRKRKEGEKNLVVQAPGSGQDLIVKWYKVTGKSVNHSVSSHSRWHTTAFDAVVICRTWLHFPQTHSPPPPQTPSNPLHQPTRPSVRPDLQIIRNRHTCNFQQFSIHFHREWGLRKPEAAAKPYLPPSPGQGRDSAEYKFCPWLQDGVCSAPFFWIRCNQKVFSGLESSGLSSGPGVWFTAHRA